MKIKIEISDDAISYGMSMETDADIHPQDLIEEIGKVIDKHIDDHWD